MAGGVGTVTELTLTGSDMKDDAALTVYIFELIYTIRNLL